MKQLIQKNNYQEYLKRQWKEVDRIYELKLFSKHIDMIEQALPHITQPSELSVLCVGARYGIEIEAFRQLGFKKVRAIDIYPRSDEIVKGDMHEIPFEKESFDVVYTHHSLDHALYPRIALGEIHRVSRKTGMWIFTIPYDDYGPEEAIDFDSPGEIRSLLQAYQLEIVWELAVSRDEKNNTQPNWTWLPKNWKNELRLVAQLKNE